MSNLTIDECKQIISKGRRQLTVAEKRIAELESLVCDMWTYYNMPTPYTPDEVIASFDMRDSLESRMESLGLLGGDDR